MTELQAAAKPRNLVIACVEDHPKTMLLLRAARNRAHSIGGKWRAVFVETPKHVQREDGSSQERILRLLTLATQMGGETSHIEAESVEKGIARLLETEKEQLVQLVVGSVEQESRWWQRLRFSSWNRVIQLARQQHIAVEIVQLSGQPYKQSPLEMLRWFKLHYFLYSLQAVAAAFLCALLLQWLLPPALFLINDQNVALLFMIACAFAAGRFGLMPGLVASVTSFLIVNYYFTAPYHTLKLSNITDLINMALFLSAAILISLFTSQTRGYAEMAAKRERNTRTLFTLYRIASGAFSREQAMQELQRKLMQMLEADVAFFLPQVMNDRYVKPVFPEQLDLQEADWQALDTCWTEMKTTGLASPSNPGTLWRFEPMIAPGGEMGVLGIRPHPGKRLDAWKGQLLTAIADQTAAVLERIEMERSMEATRISEERQKLRSMLLSSVSHDLRTPLAAIIGALSIYRSKGIKLSDMQRETLIETALQETERLDSFITNILDMTRLESGKIEFNQEWQNVQDMLQHVINRMGHRLLQHPLTVHPYPADIEIFADTLMTGQVFQNLLDNACKYTPSGTRIEIRCGISDKSGFFCEIRDHGAGLPKDKMESVFDKYARLHKEDSQIAGTGLGLSICKAVMEAQGGQITAANHPGGGAVFTLHLPQWRMADGTGGLKYQTAR